MPSASSTLSTAVSKLEDGRTRYMNYGFWNEGSSTKNPPANLVKAVIEQLDVHTLNKHAKNGQVNLEIGCGLGQSAVDAVNSIGSNVNVAGVRINKGHVAAANKLAASAGLSSKITHHHLNATKTNTLQDSQFSGAYSCEVVSEIPDDDLRVCFAALYDVLPPGTEFSYADIVKAEATLASRRNTNHHSTQSQGISGRLMDLITPTAVRMTYGDEWRPASRFNSLLSQAGFEVLSTESIGDWVFVPSWEYAWESIEKRPSMGVDHSKFMAFVGKFLVKVSLGDLASLWESGEIDYVLVKACRV